ncbi:MAG: EamA family transporter [Candidatus Methanoperedens sp.]|nr:EamA family transporter [Candidatus Methanoperedens sp.]
MDWLTFSLIGTSSLAATGILDKFILSRYIRNSAAYLIFLILVQQLFTILILAFRGVEFVYPASLLAVIAGSFQVVLWVSYLRALQVEEVSRVMPLVFVYPLFVFIASALLLGERPSLPPVTLALSCLC